MMSSVDLSVIICTLNRSGLLRKCLLSLSGQQCAPGTYEIVVVDNGSTDDTKVVVSEFARGSAKIKYLYEAEKRIGHARNVGFQASEGRYIAYLDDDAIPEPGWCAAICKAFEELRQFSQNMGTVLGGPIEPVFENGRPPWLSKELEFHYTIHDFGQQRRWFPEGRTPASANMALLREVHRDNPWNDRLPMCEDGEFLGRISRKGHRFFYVPEMRVRHFISVRRLQPNWLLGRYFAEGVAQNYLPLGFRRKARLALSASIKLPLALAISVFGPVDRRLVYGCKTRLYLGYLAGLLRLRSLECTSYIAARRKAAF